MASAVLDKWFSMTRLCRPAWWLGPSFGKELRVASRRRRSYILRCAYILLLLTYIAIVWISAVSVVRPGAMSRAQMQVAAHIITRGIVWFQFFGAQAVVLLLMSTAISEEVYRRTLGVLLSTPLGRRQVVRDKFFSRLFQVLLLVAASLPLLATVRVLGGVAWSYVIVSLCVTAATVIFVGSVSLFFSALCRRAHVAVVASVLMLTFLFVLVPILTSSSRQIMRWQISRSLPQPLFAVNPYIVLKYCPNLPAAGFGTVLAGTWAVVTCCLLPLLGARLILAGAERLVGGLALRRAMGEPVLLDRLRHGRWHRGAGTKGYQRRPVIRRVVGPPMVWKELACTFSGRQKFAAHMVLCVEILLILIVLLFPVMASFLSYGVLHRMYVWALLGLSVVITVTVSAGAMSTERESGTWPVLVLTPLTDREILLGKFAGVLRRCGPVWLLLLAYVAAFAYAEFFHPLAIAQMTIIILTLLSFVPATGFYVGMRFHRTTEAVTVTLVLLGLLWCIPPLIVGAMEHWINGRWHWASSAALVTVPFAQVSSMVVTTLDGHAVRIYWFDQHLTAWEFTRLMLVSMLGHMLISLVFAWRTVRTLRRRIL